MKRWLMIGVIGLCALSLAGEPFKNRRAESARQKYEATLKQADATHAQAVAAAKAQYQTELSAAAKAVMKDGNLEEANHIDAVSQELTDDSGGSVYISDLAEQDVRVSNGWYGKKGWFIWGPVRVDGSYSPNGIGTHPPDNGHSLVSYVLPGKFREFQTKVGLSDTVDADPKSKGASGSPLTFVVIGDGKTLFRSKPIQRTKVLESVKVDIQGVKVLELRVECPGPSAWAQAVWIEPRVN